MTCRRVAVVVDAEIHIVGNVRQQGGNVALGEGGQHMVDRKWRVGYGWSYSCGKAATLGTDFCIGKLFYLWKFKIFY